MMYSSIETDLGSRCPRVRFAERQGWKFLKEQVRMPLLNHLACYEIAS